MEFNVEINTLMTKSELDLYKAFHSGNIGTEWEVGYTEKCPNSLKEKGYGDLYSVQVFDINNSELKMIEKFEDKYLEDKQATVDLYELAWDKELLGINKYG